MCVCVCVCVCVCSQTAHTHRPRGPAPTNLLREAHTVRSELVQVKNVSLHLKKRKVDSENRQFKNE